MPKPLLVSVAVCMALSIMLSGCTAGSSQPAVSVITPPPTASQEAPRASGSVTVYYPEGADEASAAYRVSYTLPSFTAQGPAGEAMDAALAAWLDELFQRVEEERIPLADRAEGEALPTTEVTYEIREAQTPLGNFTNLLLHETCWFDNANAPEVYLTTLVFDEDGLECSLASISGVYQPEPIAAQQVWNIIGRDPAAYYGDLELEDIAAALDLYNGFTVADEGYTLYVQSGILSASEGNSAPLEFSFGRNAMYPDFVGEEISAEDYEALLPQLFMLASYCGPDFRSWKAGEEIPQADAPSYGLRLDEARMDGQELVLAGLLMKGLPGDADAQEAAKAELRLAPTASGGKTAWELAALNIT